MVSLYSRGPSPIEKISLSHYLNPSNADAAAQLALDPQCRARRMKTMLPRHAPSYTYYRTRDLRENRRSYPLPPEVEAKNRMVAHPGELGMLLRLGGVLLVGIALVTCIMMAAG
jgi:hypothetical protein